MLTVNNMVGGGAGAAVTVTTLSFTDNSVNASALTSYTFSSQAIGTAGANRQVVVCVSSAGATNGSKTISSLTVGGVSATFVTRRQGDPQPSYCSEIWIATVPSGTTGDVVVVWSAGMQECGIGVWAMYDAATDATDTAGSNASPLSASLTIPANGVAIGVAGGDQNATFTWVNLSEDFDEEIRSDQHYSGASTTSAGGATPTITATPSAASVAVRRMALASWGPA